MENYESILRQLSGKQEPVNMQVTKPTQKKFERNKNVLLSIIDIIKAIARMGIALRGHRDDSKYRPDVGEPSGHGGLGNFVELVNLTIRRGNTSLKEHLKICSSRETYISKTTQNILLNCCSDDITETIIKRVNDAQYFSILYDEASDASNKKKLSFCLRYVDKKEEICEDFLKFVHCKSGLTDKDLFKEVVDTLNELGLELKNCQGQGYDDAGAVSGIVDGLFALILKENEKALYTHCANHRLNLAISTSCKITSIRNLMNTIKKITYFFNFSPIRSEHLQRITKNGSQNKGKTKLFDVCRTRRVSRTDGLGVFEDILIYIVQTFEYIYLSPDSNVNRDTVAKAQVLLNHFNFIVTLVVIRKVFDYTHSVTELLQAK